MAHKPADRAKGLPGQLDLVKASQVREFRLSGNQKVPSNKFVGQEGKIIKNLLKPLEW